MWTYRRMLSISWTHKISNVKVLRRASQTRKLMQIIQTRHVFRHERYDLMQFIVMGKIARKRRIGSQKK